ncbi:MAG TPA: hypothetical protein VED63_02660, partial [Acidimicrobiales bacterium]|nr:hypothetical protein [Acidimicrobiales bacterium]
MGNLAATIGLLLSLLGVAVPSHPPLLGALADAESPSDLSAAGFTDVVVPASWSEIEPTEGSFSPIALTALQTEIDADRAAGLHVTLDIGTQYAPPWVFGLPGGTRFVDQFGDVFTGGPGSGEDVANAVTDSAVRDVLVPYLFALGTLSDVSAVRLGGGPFNELRYPDGGQGSEPCAFWFY